MLFLCETSSSELEVPSPPQFADVVPISEEDRVTDEWHQQLQPPPHQLNVELRHAAAPAGAAPKDDLSSAPAAWLSSPLADIEASVSFLCS
jgi:hypothetical protein